MMQGARVSAQDLDKREKIFIDRFKAHKKAGTDYRLKDIPGYSIKKS
jgi:hypothetical protein